MDVKEDGSNTLHLIKLMLNVPFTNAQVESLIFKMERDKADLRNLISHNSLDACLRIGEED